MKIAANTPEEYLNLIPEIQQEPVRKLREIIRNNIPEGFNEEMSYGMIGYVVPQSIYPKGYHSIPKLPLPFINLAAQKNYIALYHMGIYSNQTLLAWFNEEYPKHTKEKLNMGKGCIRFKKYNEIPYVLIGELVQKVNVEIYINQYESYLKNRMI